MVFLLGAMVGSPLLAQQGEDAVDQYPKEKPVSNPSALIDAKKLLIAGNVQDAEASLRKYIEKYPSDPVAYFELARIIAGKKGLS